MSLKLIKFEPKVAKAVLSVLAIACVSAAFYFVRWNFANAISSRLDLSRPESKEVIDWLIALGPSDPQTHYAAAALFEKTFNAADLSRSLSEYEMAAALSPHNYVMWINLGRARNLNGDAAGSVAALEQALALAPNYAAVQWTYGNLLIRQGDADNGFKLAAKAAAANPDYARSAVATALQIFEGDIDVARNSLGDSESINAALASTLASQERFDEAVDAWARLPESVRSGSQRKQSEKLAEQLITAKRFRLASRVVADIQPEEAAKPIIGQITNGGFEPGIKLRGAGLFEWQIAEGSEPQIGQSNVHKRTGQYGLFFIFNSFEAGDFRTISQTVAVVPGAEYEFEGFYRSDLKSTSSLKIEIADAATNSVIANTGPLTLAGDWATIRLMFAVPAGADGIIVRLAREGCAGLACRITGRLSFDDFSLRRL